MKDSVELAEINNDRDDTQANEDYYRNERKILAARNAFVNAILTGLALGKNGAYTIDDTLQYMYQKTVDVIIDKFGDDDDVIRKHYSDGDYAEFAQEFKAAAKKLANEVFPL